MYKANDLVLASLSNFELEAVEKSEDERLTKLMVSEAFRSAQAIRALHMRGWKNSLCLCKLCVGKTFDEIHRVKRGIQVEAYDLQGFQKRLRDFFPTERGEEDGKGNYAEDEDIIRQCNDMDEKGLGELTIQFARLQTHLSSIREKRRWVLSETEQELQTIRDLEHQKEEETAVLERYNEMLYSMSAEAKYLTFLLSPPRYAPLCLISSSGKRNVFFINSSRLSFDCIPDQNLNWCEINSAWSILSLAMKIAQNSSNIANRSLTFSIKPLRGVTIVYGNGKAYVLQGYGDTAMANKNYVRAVLALAIYVKEVCTLSKAPFCSDHFLSSAPVEKMFRQVLSGYSTITEVHMNAVVLAIVRCCRLFQCNYTETEVKSEAKYDNL